MRNRMPCQRDAGTRLATALRRRPFSACNKGNRRRLQQASFWRRFFKFAIINLKLFLFRYEQRTSWNAAYYFENTMDLIHWVRLQQFQWNRYYSYACQKWVKVLSVPKKESRVTLGLSWRKKKKKRLTTFCALMSIYKEYRKKLTLLNRLPKYGHFSEVDLRKNI